MAKKRTIKKVSPKAESSEIPSGMMSKSEVIRNIIQNGTFKPSEIIAKAKEQGVEVTGGLVAAVKGTLKKSGHLGALVRVSKGQRKAKRIFKKGAKSAAPKDDTASTFVGNGRVTELELAKLALKMGGIDATIAALQKLKD